MATLKRNRISERTSERRSLDGFVRRRGRLITVGQMRWKWYCGKGGGVVAYSEAGERRCDHAATIMGVTPNTFERGQWKRTSDGMLLPSKVAAWLTPNREN